MSNSRVNNHFTLADVVTNELHSAILQGQFAGGQHLRINLLAEHFGTSHMPVRDALTRLASLGLVEIIPRRGARVLDLSISDLKDTFVARSVLEPVAARIATEMVGGTVNDHVREALEAHESSLLAGDHKTAREHHRNFHFLLYEGSGSRWLLHAIEPIWQNSERYRFAVPGGDTNFSLSSQEHHAILSAFEKGDANGTEQAVREHVLNAGKRLALLLPQPSSSK